MLWAWNGQTSPRSEGEVDRITLVGLVFEAAAGLHRAVGPPIERQCELAGQDFEILIRLARTPGGRLRMSDLASQTALTPSGLTRAIDRLSHAGLVEPPGLPRGPSRQPSRRLTVAGEASHAPRRSRSTAPSSPSCSTGLSTRRRNARSCPRLRKLRDRVNPGAAVLTALTSQ